MVSYGTGTPDGIRFFPDGHCDTVLWPCMVSAQWYSNNPDESYFQRDPPNMCHSRSKGHEKVHPGERKVVPGVCCSVNDVCKLRSVLPRTWKRQDLIAPGRPCSPPFNYSRCNGCVHFRSPGLRALQSVSDLNDARCAPFWCFSNVFIALSIALPRLPYDSVLCAGVKPGICEKNT